ncbi:V-type proton ATPase subunit d [Dictyocoela muelleri]|nr:V-type proton ATPase subunit d [Dictyocoela muelleri]
MDIEHSNSMLYGFLLSDIHDRANHLLTQENYTLLMQCETLEDLIIKLSQTGYSSYINENVDINKKSIKTKLYESLTNEFTSIYKYSDKDVKTLLTYFHETLMIDEFILCLALKIEDKLEINEENLGFFPELHTLKFSNDMNDVFRFCIDNCFLKKYEIVLNDFKNCDFKSLDVQLLHAILLKDHRLAFYKKINNSMAHMKKILRFEGDRQIIEMVMNSIGQDIDRKKYFSEVSELKGSVLIELMSVEGYDEFVSVMMNTKYSEILENPLPRLQKMEIDLNFDSFLLYNDISCVYSYLKLKELEIKNILWIVECLVSGRKDNMDQIFTLENWV